MEYKRIVEIDESIEHLERLLGIIDRAYFISIKFSKSNYIPSCPITGSGGVDLGTTEVTIRETDKENLYWGYNDYYFPKDSFREGLRIQIKQEISHLEKLKKSLINKKWYQFWL